MIGGTTMKKIYLRPETELIVYRYQENLLQSTSIIESTRNAGGGPTEDSGTKLPTVVGETDGTIDPFSDSDGWGKGQGSGGAGNRAKGFDGWDEW